MCTRVFGGAVLVASLALAGCSAAAPEPEPLTVSAAGARYLEVVCPVNEAWDAVDVEVDRLRLVLGRGDTGDVEPLVASLTALEESSVTAAERLDDPSVGWPAGAADAVAQVAETLRSDAEEAAEVAKLDAAQATAHRWAGSDVVGDAAVSAREALQLPADSSEACAARSAEADAQ